MFIAIANTTPAASVNVWTVSCCVGARTAYTTCHFIRSLFYRSIYLIKMNLLRAPSEYAIVVAIAAPMIP